MEQSFSKYGLKDKIVLMTGYILIGLFTLLIIIPIVYVIIASFMDPNILNSQGISFDFSHWSLDAYERVLGDASIWRSFYNSIIYSVVFTVVSVLITLLTAYPMSRSELVGRKFFNVLFIITMFFGGGLIPTYLVVSDLGLLDSMWALILPGALSIWNMIIVRSNFQTMPQELREASTIDGANEMQYFFKILLPLSMPIIAVIALWNFVGMWNSYFDALIYLQSADKRPLQLILRGILINSTPESGMVSDISSYAEQAKLAELLKYATIVISSLPLIAMYPFFQKYFEKGALTGAVKG